MICNREEMTTINSYLIVEFFFFKHILEKYFRPFEFYLFFEESSKTVDINS